MYKRKKELIIAGNWKMNKVPKKAEEWLKKVTNKTEITDCKVIICVPFIDIPIATEVTKNSKISIGAQNCHFEDFGAYTGEISAKMLREIGVEYVILGHSERRTYFLETDEIINKKIKSAIKAGLKVIFCIGETQQEREFNVTDEKIFMQLKNGLSQISVKEFENIIIAYEPVWAIGTGKSATKEEAEAVCCSIRQALANLYGISISEKISIIYGGSITPSNAQEFLNMENIDGALIGGAALDADEFLKIVKFSQS